MAGRGIDKVFDFLVSPDEQREARRQADERAAEDSPLPFDGASVPMQTAP